MRALEPVQEVPRGKFAENLRVAIFRKIKHDSVHAKGVPVRDDDRKLSSFYDHPAIVTARQVVDLSTGKLAFEDDASWMSAILSANSLGPTVVLEDIQEYFMPGKQYTYSDYVSFLIYLNSKVHPHHIHTHHIHHMHPQLFQVFTVTGHVFSRIHGFLDSFV